MNRTKRSIGIALFLLLLLIGPPMWSVYREMRQARLDHALIEAIKADNEKKALEALAQGANGEARDTGKTPTIQQALHHLWVRIRHPEQKEAQEALPVLLLLYREDACDPNPNKRSPRWGPGPDIVLVHALLDHGANVSDRDGGEEGWTPLHWACRYSNRDTVNLLLKHKANIEAVDENHWTPLIIATIYGNYEEIHLLLEQGARINAKDVEGDTAIDIAIKAVHPYPETSKIIALLRKCGAK